MFFPVMLIKACSTFLLFLYIYIYIFFTRKKILKGFTSCKLTEKQQLYYFPPKTNRSFKLIWKSESYLKVVGELID